MIRKSNLRSFGNKARDIRFRVNPPPILHVSKFQRLPNLIRKGWSPRRTFGLSAAPPPRPSYVARGRCLSATSAASFLRLRSVPFY
ncbi:hypothetical protein NL676_017900 [Syzygium grande]|nr:hypothetical protein NL676_017900 [Syzygium grande]